VNIEPYDRRATSDMRLLFRRVVLLIRSLNCGGAERQLVELAKALVRNSIEVTVVTFYEGGPIWDELHRSRSVALRSLSKRGRWDNLRTFTMLTGFLRKYQPAILHSYLVEPSIVGLIAGRWAGVPAIVWGVRASNMDYGEYEFLNGLTFRCARSLSRFVDLIIANSEAGKNYHLERGYRPKRFRAIANGIDTDWFRPSADSRRLQRMHWAVRDDEVLVGIAARFDPMKDHVTFLNALAKAVVAQRGLRIAIVGDGLETVRARLLVHAQEVGLTSIIWAGELADMNHVYPAFDIICSSSAFGEGFSNSIAEAMSSEVTCVVTDVGDSARIVGEAGIVVPPKDPDALASAVIQLARLRPEERAARGRSARRRVIELFGIPSMTARTIAAYQELLDPTASPDRPKHV
jgi:glycosyltransferase involved in cell wall biosynthesis